LAGGGRFVERSFSGSFRRGVLPRSAKSGHPQIFISSAWERLPAIAHRECAIAPLVTRKFNVVGRLVIMDDITERIELESSAHPGDKLSFDRTAGRWRGARSDTPLAVISSYTQMLAKQLQSDPQKAGLLEKITRRRSAPRRSSIIC